MKHIKPYNNIEVINDLSDCLQEIFDKYKVTHDFNFRNYDYINWRISGVNGRHYISINNIPTALIGNKILTDIEKIKNIIEKRIRYKIVITSSGRWSGYYILIKLK